MTGIDSALASMLVSRIDSVLESVGAGSRTSPAQSGATGLTVDTPAPADAAAALLDTPPPASAQAILSEVALTLDAISRFGGEATPAVIGEAPIWPAPPAIDTPAAAGGLFAAGAGGAAASAAGSAAAAASASASASADSAAQADSAQAGSTTSAAAVGAAATAMPVAALAEALEQTVNESGLFYESHLAQWLGGTYPAEAIASEPQTRLAAESLQLPLDWSNPGAGADMAGMPGWQASSASVPAGGGWLPHELPPQLSMPTFGAGMHAGTASYPGAATDGAAWRGAQTTLLEDAAFGGSNAGHTAGLSPDVRASIAASIHPATIPLVRQQLDVLATQQFRWTGEVWPGAKLDWTIEPERERRGRSGDAEDDGQQGWRTRVTLALPTLGTVDAELVLNGTQLVVRMQASPGGAARLNAGGAAFGRRLEAAGIELAGLQIREIGGTAPAAAGAAASAATSAYARAAAAAQAQAQAESEARDAQSQDVSDVEVRDGPLDPARGFGAQAFDAEAQSKRGPVPSPIDRLFDDPFEWSGS
ncbi:flagellar hook-length control protein FliK [Trinickia dinghuensis]|uniref:Flagellar hook-length control protein FliK n=1 Tax=Trinickia dinghuensis TaxID=2291023 RepID=A0A3D8JYT6_9BURK|nr:flagellar hook-length control protein FliK [Trinickia dinghuensis]RDU98327.1 flagellar hook-length control protein FliK [Trinickia dinghuensis]